MVFQQDNESPNVQAMSPEAASRARDAIASEQLCTGLLCACAGCDWAGREHGAARGRTA